MILNKKGTDKIIAIYWFAIMFIVAAAIFYMAVIYYGEPYDGRGMEGHIMIDKIVDCIVNDHGEIQPINNLLEECGISFKVEEYEDWRDNEQYYIEINKYDFNSNSGVSLEKIKVGNENYADNLQINTNYLSQPEVRLFMTSERFYALDSGNEVIVEINVTIGKVSKNDL